MTQTNIKYIGDGVYASFDGYQIKLAANDHKNPTDTVYLPYHVFLSLIDYGEEAFEINDLPLEEDSEELE